MGGQYPLLNRLQVEAILEKAGFVQKRHYRSSHAQVGGVYQGQEMYRNGRSFGRQKKNHLQSRPAVTNDKTIRHE